MSFSKDAAGGGMPPSGSPAVPVSFHPISLSPASGCDETGGGSRARTVMRLRERVARIEGIHLHRLDAPGPVSACGPGKAAGAQAGPVSSPAAGRRRVIPLGLRHADAALCGGFPAEGLTEIHVDETRGAGTGAGFALSLAVLLSADALRPALWIGDRLAFSEAGLPYLPGLVGHGLDPGGLLLVRAARLEQALWAGEEAARSAALSLVILEVRGNPGRLSLEGTRRLHFRAREAGIPLLLLRQGGRAEPTAAPFRLRVESAPAADVRDIADARLIGGPVFGIRVEKSPAGRPNSFLLEWNPHERRFQESLAAAAPQAHGRQSAVPADRPDPARKARPVLALARAS